LDDVPQPEIHEEIVRALATRRRNRLSGSFRTAVCGANDGLVSNLSLVMDISASGASNRVVLLSGVAGLLDTLTPEIVTKAWGPACSHEFYE
jgi:VIT1/CCC1 family predicted Fe2+/Mn2+ transporter